MDDGKYLKSTAGVITKAISTIEQNILGVNEQLDPNPASFVNQMLTLGGDLVSNTFFELLSNRREIYTTDAILKSSLLGKLIKTENHQEILARSAKMTFIIGFSEKELKATAISSGIGVKKHTINKGATMEIINRPIFKTTNPIEIRINSTPTGETIYAKMINDPTSSINDNSSPVLRMENVIGPTGTSMIYIFVPMSQYEMSEKEFTLTRNEKTFKFGVKYFDHLVGFDVLYTEDDGKSWRKLNGVHEGTYNMEGYMFSIQEQVGSNMLKIRFSQSPSAFAPKDNSIIKIVTYTSKGEEGNFSIPNHETDSIPLNFGLAQDEEDDYQMPILNLKVTTGVFSEESIGGMNEPDTEEIRRRILNTSGISAISPKAIQQVVYDETGFDTTQYNFDLSLGYMVNSIIKMSDTEVIPTLMRTVNFNLSDIPVDPDTNTRIILPNQSFRADDEVCDLITNPIPLETYTEQYIDRIGEHEYSFPFFLRIQLERNIRIDTYDMARNEHPIVNYKFFNDNSYSEVNITDLLFYRNPLGDEPNVYSIQFNVRVNSVVISNLLIDSSMLNVKLRISTLIQDFVLSESSTIIGINQATNTVTFKSNLYTDNSITKSEGLGLIDHTLVALPRGSEFLDKYFINEFALSVYVLIKSNNEYTTQYDDIKDDADVLNGRYVAAVYEVPELTLLDNISNRIKIVSDLKQAQPTYQTYAEDLWKMYDQPVYKTDDDGNLILETRVVTISENSSMEIKEPTLIHSRGDFILDDDGNKQLLNAKGSVIFEDGIPLIDKTKPVVQYCRLRNVPVYDRIYQLNYDDVREHYLHIVKQLTNIQENILDGCELYLGVRNTTGVGPYVFKNTFTNLDEVLDDMALSFALGVRFENKINLDTEDLVKQIINYIIKYILDLDNITILSMDEMFDYIKLNVPNIKAFVLQSVNGYKGGTCQEIRIIDGAPFSTDKLCIRHVLDKDGVTFIPDIKIQILD